jgi:hypothetical protein
MPLKLAVGLRKQIGLPDAGSIDASCHVEFELDAGITANELDGFHRRARDAYIACAQAVNDELARHRAASNALNNSTPAPAATARYAQGAPNGANGNGHPCATPKQLTYIRRLAGRIQDLGLSRLEDLAHARFQKPVDDLTGWEASKLIDTLKAVQEGQLTLDAAMNGVAA